MMYTLAILMVPLILVLGLSGFFEAGRRLGIRRLKDDPEGGRNGTAVIETAIFALLGLLLAFTFSGASSRFDNRKALILEEVNAIGTAYLRLDLLSEDKQPALRDSFRKYVDLRLGVYQKLPDMEAAKEQLAQSAVMQRKIWTQVMDAIGGSTKPGAAIILPPAINAMFDITTLRTWAAEIHPPAIVFVLLVFLTLISALIAGYATAGSKSRSLCHMLGFVTITAATVYIIFDLEFPRMGWIRVDGFDQAMIELRQSLD